MWTKKNSTIHYVERSNLANAMCFSSNGVVTLALILYFLNIDLENKYLIMFEGHYVHII